MPLPQDFIERLTQANRIEDVMSSYVQIKRAGRNSKCLCPFHSEKTPSCTIYPDTDSFYCFGCGAGGDVITFIMKMENLDYYEAVKFLAERANIELPEDGYNDVSTSQRQRLYEINKAAAKFFYQNLKTEGGKVALQYLISRKLTPETVKKFGIGYAPDKRTELKFHLTSEGFTERELVQASLLSEKDGRTFDFFRNRIMFPIFDLRGNVIGFSGRTLDKEAKGFKYLNTKDTLVYKKSKVLFGIYFAKNTATKSGKIILCEGNVDVITLHQAGFDNAIATCGTAMTPEHARILSQYCEEVLICFDSDGAGQEATKKAIKILNDAGMKSKVVKISGVKDVDDYIKTFGATKFKLLLDNSEGAIAFELENCKAGLDLESDVGKVEYLKRAFNVLANIQNHVEREVYISRVAREQNVSVENIKIEIESILKKKDRLSKKKEWQNITNDLVKRDVINPEAEKYPKEAKAEQGIISFLFYNPDKLRFIKSKISPENFVTSFNKRVYLSLLERLEGNLDYSLSSFSYEFSVDEMGKLSEILAKAKDLTIDESTVLDYCEILLSHKPKEDKKASEMSDDEFLDFFNNLKNKK